MSTVPRQSLLLVFAHGVGPDAAEALQRAAPALAAGARRPLVLPDAAVADEILRADASAELRALGVAVDRSSLVLRPHGRSDRCVVDGLSRRATGPAPVTLLGLTTALARARHGGVRAAHAAVPELAELVEQAAAAVRAGEPTEVWLAGLGAPRAVRTTFDFAAAWRRAVQHPLDRDLSLRVAARRAVIAGANVQALRCAAAILAAPPFAGCGTVTATGDGLCVHAARGVAFGERRLAARAPAAGEGSGAALLPRAPATADALDLGGLLARFWLRAVELHVRAADGLRTATAAGVRNDVATAPLPRA